MKVVSPERQLWKTPPARASLSLTSGLSTIAYLRSIESMQDSVTRNLCSK